LEPPVNLYYIAGSFRNPEIVKAVSDQEVFDCSDLYSIQEEADTRLILQALHADKRLKELGKQSRIILKQLSQFPDFEMNRQCNTDLQGAPMGYFD
jgi:hypothetical protein